MKLGSVTKRDKRDTSMSKSFDDNVKSANCDVIISFPICGQSREIEKPDFGRMVCNTLISINTNLLS